MPQDKNVKIISEHPDLMSLMAPCTEQRRPMRVMLIKPDFLISVPSESLNMQLELSNKLTKENAVLDHRYSHPRLHAVLTMT